MYCLKCGRETGSEKVFCDDCLTAMEQHPVKPGTPIHLPRRDQMDTPKKTSRTKRAPNLEEQNAFLKKVILWLGILLLFAVLVLAGAILLLTYL